MTDDSGILVEKDQPIFVTGATGWLGRRVVKALTTGLPDANLPAITRSQRVICLVPETEPASVLDVFGVEIARGNLTHIGSIREFLKDAEGGTLIHLAGIIHPPMFKTNVWNEINVDGTLNLVSEALAGGVRRVIVMSSNSPFGANRSRDELFDEQSDYNPYMGYGRSKKQMEDRLNDLRKTQEAPITVLRSPWFYGPGQPPRQSLFFKMVRTGKFPIIGNGQNLRSMGYVDNLAQGVVRAAFHEAASKQDFWIADEKPYTTNEIVATVKNAIRITAPDLSVTDRQLRLPEMVATIARQLDSASQAIGLYHQKIHVLSEMNLDIACSIDKAKKLIGYSPEITLETGMLKSTRWCIEHGLEI